jgi:hypothetical protein
MIRGGSVVTVHLTGSNIMSSLRCGIAGVHCGGNEQITFSTDPGASLGPMAGAGPQELALGWMNFETRDFFGVGTAPPSLKKAGPDQLRKA